LPISRPASGNSHDDYFNAVHDQLERVIDRVIAAASQSNSVSGNNVCTLLKDRTPIEYFVSRQNYVSFGKSLIENAKTIWERSDLTTKRDLMFTLFPYGTIYDKHAKLFSPPVTLGDQKNDVAVLLSKGDGLLTF
jgi:hypothetical protein